MRSSGRKIIYTVPELARLAGQSPYKMENQLRGNGVRFFPGGPSPRSKRIVLLSSLTRAWPELVEAILFRSGEDD